MFNSQMYSKWRKALMQLLPDNCASRLTNFVLLVVGIFEAKSVYLSVVARKLPIAAKKLSLEKRLERFLNNEAVDVRKWYHPWLNWLLISASSSGKINLVVDTLKPMSLDILPVRKLRIQ